MGKNGARHGVSNPYARRSSIRRRKGKERKAFTSCKEKSNVTILTTTGRRRERKKKGRENTLLSLGTGKLEKEQKGFRRLYSSYSRLEEWEEKRENLLVSGKSGILLAIIERKGKERGPNIGKG